MISRYDRARLTVYTNLIRGCPPPNPRINSGDVHAAICKLILVGVVSICVAVAASASGDEQMPSEVDLLGKPCALRWCSGGPRLTDLVLGWISSPTDTVPSG
jgi:hypothetical protein